jgi:GTPase SAR1 family protein
MRLASGSADKTVRIWDVSNGQEIGRSSSHTKFVRAVAWISDQLLASGGEKDEWHIYHTDTNVSQRSSRSGEGWVLSLAASPSGGLFAAGFGSGAIALVDVAKFRAVATLRGHRAWVDGLAWMPDGKQLVSASGDGTIRLWDVTKKKQSRVLEAHTKQVRSVTVSVGGRVLASKGDDALVRLWDCATWDTIAELPETQGHTYWTPGIAFHPSTDALATHGEECIRLWDLDVPKLVDTPATAQSVKYVAAKIALVGDSGVGKTSLGWLLAQGTFQQHPSTHGQQFWVVEKLAIKRTDGTDCEAVLWDFAGQPDYRLVHALFMEDVDLALVLFDATQPLRGVEYWLQQLSRKGERRAAILVAARTDRGTSTLTVDELLEFCAAEKVTGGYIATSALTSSGVAELVERMKAAIDWDGMSATVTTATFNRVKEFILRLKQSGTGVLLTQSQLAERFRESDPTWQFTMPEFTTAVKHLSTHGYVASLRASDGEEFVLLAPELLAVVASSLVLEARRNAKDLGAVDEGSALRGGLHTPELAGLSHVEQTLLFDTAVGLFLKHNLCFRETLGTQTLLIFPSLINQKRPQVSAEDVIEYVSYRVTGPIENVYASLVVQLGYTNTFARTKQWQNQAEYETAAGDLCGFRQVEEAEGQIELVLYHSSQKAHAAPLFQNLVELFLRGRDLTVKRFPTVLCSRCGYRPQRADVVKHFTDGKKHLFCAGCGTKIALSLTDETISFARGDEPPHVTQEGNRANERTRFEAALVRIKAIARDLQRSRPSCFISYAWGNPKEERWVLELADDLKNAGIGVLLDQVDNSRIGLNIARFAEQIDESDFVVIVGTPNYLAKYKNKVSPGGTVVAGEMDLINQRLLGTDREKASILPMLLDGEPKTALPPHVRGKVYCDFRPPASYFRSLFDLMLTIYAIDHRDPAVVDLREAFDRP